MRMYTSYNGMRSTGGAAAPSGSTLRKCVLAGTPSLKTLMQLLIGIVVPVTPAGALLGEPGVERRRHQPVGAFEYADTLATRAAERQERSNGQVSNADRTSPFERS